MAAERPGLVLLTADVVGGVWTYAVELARELSRGGTRVALVTMGGPLDDARRAELAPLHPAITVHHRPYRLEWMTDPWDDVDRAGEWLLDLERALQPDVVHLNQLAFGALSFQAPRLVVAHSCVLSWWRAVHGTDAPTVWDEYRGRVGAGLRGAPLVGAPTRAMLHAVRALYALADDGVVLPNGRDVAHFPAGDKEPFVLSAGRLWDEAKNLAALEAVAPALAWPVRVAGADVHPDGGRRPARGVEPLGQLAPRELAAYMARASIYALPARYEPFGLGALEAALAGCALVLGDIASLRELWDGAAVFVPPDDHAALQAALAALAADAPRRRDLADRARARALGYTTARMADACVAAYALAAARAGAVPEVACAS